MVVPCDVSRSEDVERAVARVLDVSGGRLDILVNAAQSLSYGSLRRTSEEELDAAWQSGPLAAFRLMSACLAGLRASRGLVVNVASGAGITAPPAMGAYAMVKEAMRTLSRVAAVEWGPSGVRVVTLCPLADSPGLRNWESELALDVERDVVAHVPLRRLGDPEADIGGVVVFLASSAGSYISGSTLMVDGGYTYLR
jgi:NAD(P)-dependent dehydrogenase (short-subunit alcohol dehydrogenase family)